MPLLFSPVCSPTHLLQLQSFSYYLELAWWRLPLLLSGGACYTLAAFTCLPLSKHTGGGAAAAYLQIVWRSASPPICSGVSYALAAFTNLPLTKNTGGEVLPLLPSPARLFIYSLSGESPSPLSGALGTLPSLLSVFFFQLLVYYSDCFLPLFFPGWGQSVQGTMLIYFVLLSSAGGLCLSKQSGSWHLAVWEPFGFLHLT
jgi:hypothetical protein